MAVRRCLVVLSGGPDSVTAAYWAKEQGFDIHAITFNYGQKAQVEIERASEIAKRLGAEFKLVDLRNLNEVYRGVTSLVDEGMPVTDEFTDEIIVPFRNGVFLSVAVAYAAGIGADTILYGAHASDEPFYPDCRREFYQAFQEAARLGTGLPISISSPFSDIPKSGVIREAVRLGVPLDETWSCYLNGPRHCGVCESCRNRKRAFREAGVRDPTEYAA
ncbi:MAG: 7-cyano-7-deazaguanine synthase QueC [Candidatus Bathyarchaeota archaeon]|nr:7-cyano-7-deazaguanine synthase QueC [Candidatus Bathyarchaeota archaeon]